MTEKLDVSTLTRVRDAYPKIFPGDLASIKLIELHTASGKTIWSSGICACFSTASQPSYAAKAADPAGHGRTKFKSHPYSIAAIFPLSGKWRRSAPKC
ncbi:MAG: hypothetical protein MRJ92_08090 [Nitrospira sp.]|nr:hypothetical protein [Nitrospira sp.]